MYPSATAVSYNHPLAISYSISYPSLGLSATHVLGVGLRDEGEQSGLLPRRCVDTRGLRRRSVLGRRRRRPVLGRRRRSVPGRGVWRVNLLIPLVEVVGVASESLHI